VITGRWLRAILLAGVFFAAILGSLPGAAHPYHVTVAEAELNAATGRLEVALRLLPEDLIRALEARDRRRGDEAGGESGPERSQAQEPRHDELLADLVREAFTVTTADGRSAPLHWVGSEASVKAVWLYFELDLGGAPAAQDGPAPDGSLLDGITLANRLLLDLEPTQTNTVTLRFEEERQTLTLTPRSPEREIRWPPPPPPSDAPR
jgi:hypothetical protein